MPRGKVKRWFPDRGTGYITDEADGADVFFGDRVLRGLRTEDIRPGLVVEFERDQGEKAPAWARIRSTGSPTCQAAGSRAWLVPMPPRSGSKASQTKASPRVKDSSSTSSATNRANRSRNSSVPEQCCFTTPGRRTGPG